MIQLLLVERWLWARIIVKIFYNQHLKLDLSDIRDPCFTSDLHPQSWCLWGSVNPPRIVPGLWMCVHLCACVHMCVYISCVLLFLFLPEERNLSPHESLGEVKSPVKLRDHFRRRRLRESFPTDMRDMKPVIVLKPLMLWLNGMEFRQACNSQEHWSVKDGLQTLKSVLSRLGWTRMKQPALVRLWNQFCNQRKRLEHSGGGCREGQTRQSMQKQQRAGK